MNIIRTSYIEYSVVIVEVTKDDVIESVKKPTAYKSEVFTTEPSRNCESFTPTLYTYSQ